jgi:hypothetical protein
MKCLYFLVLCSLLAACSSPKVVGFKSPEQMSRGEVIQAARECVSAKLKPTVQYVSQRTEFGNVVVPVDVYCDIYR